MITNNKANLKLFLGLYTNASIISIVDDNVVSKMVGDCSEQEQHFLLAVRPFTCNVFDWPVRPPPATNSPYLTNKL